MSSRTSAHRAEEDRRRRLNQVRAQQATQVRRRHHLVLAGWAAALVTVAAVVALMLATSRPTSTASRHPAPTFALTDTAGHQVRLGDLRGGNVLLYPNEGVGCGACFAQMTEIERHAADFAALGVRVLPIVMNRVEEVRPALAEYAIKTPYLIDADGSVSRAYGVLGKGMHADLPGHGFILIDAQGVQRWYGEYPSMYLSSQDLLAEIRKHLTA